MSRGDDPRRRSSQIVTGVILIAIGLILLGERVGLALDLDFGRLWPVILLALGLGRMAVPDRDGRRRGGWLVFLGALFLLHTFDVLTLRQSWPLFIVAGGVSILLGCRQPRAPRPGPEGRHGA